MANWHGYISVEDLGLLSEPQNEALLAALAALGPESASQPAHLNHTRTVGDATIVEALFDEDDLTTTAFRQMLADVLEEDLADIDHTERELTFLTDGATDVIDLFYDDDYYLRVTLFDSLSAAWTESGDECRGCLVGNLPFFTLSPEGFGASSVGGAGGTVYDVTNLNDDGTGSFREAVEAEGARIVTFSVSGLITLDSLLNITNPYISILGETAPGTGITLKTDPANDASCLWITTNDVIVRYLKIRPGPSTDPSSSRDSLTIEEGASNVIMDHCSFSWASDENTSAYDQNPGGAPDAPHDITFQWCIISEGLHNTNHPSSPHSMGMLLKYCYDISVHHCLLAHNHDRNPSAQQGGVLDYVNNVIYNYGKIPLWAYNPNGDVDINYVGNYTKPGLDSDLGMYELEVNSGGEDTFHFWVEGNIGHHRLTDDLAENLVVNPEYRYCVRDYRNTAPQVATSGAEIAYTQVLNDAGASRSRDAIDIRVVADVIAGTGNIIDDPSDVGGW